jgi:RimJ/RimL family protein N-acetyltransferase
LHNQLKIRKVKINDIRFIYNLRNDRLTRLSSLNNKKITFKQHKIWFLRNWNSFFYLFLVKKKIAGYIKLKKKNNFFLLNYALHNHYRGKKYSSKMILLLISRLKKKFKNNYIKAVVKKKNVRSLRNLQSINFRKYYTLLGKIFLLYQI